MIFMMMMMSATPWRKLSVPLTILLMSTSMTEVRLEGEVDEEPGGMFPQEVAVLNGR